MFQNYFFLNRFVIEANTLIAGSKIHSIFSQERSKLVISLIKDKEEFFLELCVIPGAHSSTSEKNIRVQRKTL